MRTAHPNLYGMYITYALLGIALGLNFIFLHPAFQPLGIPKWTIGAAFVVCGAIQLTLLLFVWNPTALRLLMALAVALMTFWAAVLTWEYFRLHQTSLQLPITYVGLAALGFLLLAEPFINPVTATPTPESIDKLRVNGDPQ